MVLLVLVVIVAGVAIIGGGNTVSGFGSDLERSGEKIQDATK
ncbi:MAG: entericidin [Pseudomonas fluorescens]|nr:MAG: entericidin [Pseudomonas fluorescens]